MEIRPRDVRHYETPNERDLFFEWFDSLKDNKTKSIRLGRLDRLLLGSLGDHWRFNGDLYELRIHYGPGYRIYCGDLDGETIILLWGGTKRTQKRDIQKAKTYWQQFKESRP